MHYDSRIQRTAPKGPGLRERMPFLCFALLCVSMFVNLILAFLHARGLPASTTLVTAVQALVTACALPAFLSSRVRLTATTVVALSFIVGLALMTNILNPFNPKTIYDTVLIPIYIALGISASKIRPKWMNYLLLFVLLTVLIEILFPSLYTNLFDPAGYFASTREWVAEQSASAATDDGLYAGSYRAGGSQFAFTDHRIGGAFLEPLSLGYFAFLMSIYYAGLYRGSLLSRGIAIVICLVIALASDSRAPVALILLSTVVLTFRIRLPGIVLWLIFPVVIGTAYVIYLVQFSFLYGDTFYRLGVTFNALARVNIGEILVGMVPLGRVGDSGIVYMLRCVGLVGMPVAIWLYSGVYTRRPGTNVTFFSLITVYLTATLMFGGATLSIKTASLLGYLVGFASQSRPQPGPTRLIRSRAATKKKGLPAPRPDRLTAAAVRHPNS